ncbi:MAG: creatininase family protein [Hyphomicrobiaceae bacterium]
MAKPRWPKPLWQDMTSAEFSGADRTRWVAVLPIGAIEQHGPHLPVSTDTLIAAALVERAIAGLPEGLPVTFLPVLPIGKSNEHLAFPGTLSLSWQTLVSLLVEIGESVARAGLSKLVILNTHGGNREAIGIAGRELRVRRGMLVVTAGWSRPDEAADHFPAAEQGYDIHAGDEETSILLALRPDLVRMDRARHFTTLQVDLARRARRLRAHGPLSQISWVAGDLNPDGAAGNAAAATPEKGRLLVDHYVAGFLDLLGEVDGFTPDWLGKPVEGPAGG